MFYRRFSHLPQKKYNQQYLLKIEGEGSKLVLVEKLIDVLQNSFYITEALYIITL